MNKILKWILILGAGIGTLVAVIIICLPFFIDPNDYKEQISSIVQKQTGRQLSIPGNIELQISPRLDLSFSLGEIELAASDAFSGTDFVSSKLAEIKVALWPLISQKELQINSIHLSGVQVNLLRGGDGQTNWQDLAGSPSSKNSQDSPQKPKQEKGAPQKSQLPAIDIGSISIEDINLTYTDQLTKKIISLENFNLSVGHLQAGNPFPVSADAIFTLQEQKQVSKASIATNLTLTFDLTSQNFLVNDFTLKGKLEADPLPSAGIELALGGDFEINILEEKVDLHKFIIQQNDLIVETVLSVRGFKTPAVKGSVSIAEYSPKKHLKELGIILPQFTDPAVLEAFSASLNITLQNNQLNAQEINLQLDDTVIRADASIKNLQQPAYALNLHVGQFDLDRYAVKKKEQSEENASAPKTPSKQTDITPQTTTEQPLLPVDLLRGLTFAANITIDELKAAKIRMTELQIQADGNDGLIQLHPFSAKLYNGTMVVTGEIDASQDTPVLTLKNTLNGVELGPMMLDTIGKEEITGTANIEMDVKTRGVDKKSLTQNSNGTVALSLANGKIAKLQILQTIRLAKALLDNESITESATNQPTGFAALTASGKLTNGIFVNDDLLAESDLMKVTGNGTVNLVTEQIDYLLTVSLTDRIERSKKTGLVSLGGTPIPYRVKGSFAQLEQSAALDELLKSQAKDALFNVLQKQLDKGDKKDGKSKNDSGSLLNEGLKGLFK